MQKLSKYDAAPEMYERGMSIGDIAGYYGVTRQSMWKTLRRRDVKFRSNLRYSVENHFYRGRRYQERRASRMVDLAIEKGILARKPCEECGATEDVRGHHDDYNKPLEVRWLCAKHHFEWHKENRPIQLTSELPRMSRKEIATLGGKNSWKTRREEVKAGDSPSDKKVWLLTGGVPC